MCNTKNLFIQLSATVLMFLIKSNGYMYTKDEQPVGSTKQEWGYITVRPHAHMFWWLYYTTANVSHHTERPLIIWLQGGPGMPSSGYGNFFEIGPVDMNFEEKRYAWTKRFNVLFIDNPVGVGYSYFSNTSAKMVQNNLEIGKDLVSFIKSFLSKFQVFQTIPIYIFGESYGGKMAVEFAYQLLQEISEGRVNVSLKGIGLGDAYISPIHYIVNYASFAFNLGLVDKQGFNEINSLTQQVTEALSKEDYEGASDVETKLTDTVIRVTQGMDVYNIVLKSNRTSLPTFLNYQDSCNYMMNTRIKEMLNIPREIEWSFLNDDIYNSLLGDLMRPVTRNVETLLNETNIKIIVYNGVFDFLVNTAGTAMWMDELNWRYKSQWQQTAKEPLEIDMVNEGYVKRMGNLVFYIILRAGHSVPVDNPVAMDEILRRELLSVNYVL